MRKRTMITIGLLFVVAIAAVVFLDPRSKSADMRGVEETATTTASATTAPASAEDSPIEHYATTTDMYEISARLPDQSQPRAAVVRTYINRRIDDFITQARGDISGARERGFTGRFSRDIDTAIYETETTLSYVVRISTYLGGANANATVKSFVFDTQSGDIIPPEDMIPEKHRNKFMQALKSRLYEINGVSPGDNDLFANTIGELRFRDLENMYLTSEAVVVAFSEYEIAPGAAGVVRIGLERGTYTTQ